MFMLKLKTKFYVVFFWLFFAGVGRDLLSFIDHFAIKKVVIIHVR